MSSADENSAETLAALDAGAIDFIQKPTALATEKIFEVRGELIEKIKAAAAGQVNNLIRMPQLKPHAETIKISNGSRRDLFDVIVLGVSTGGPQGLRRVIPELPADFPVPIAMVLHMPVGYTSMYAEKLNEISAIEVREAKQGDALRAGLVLLAPAGKHLCFKQQTSGKVTAHLSLRPLDTPHRPAVDVLFQSAAEVFQSRTLGIVMTGMGADGRTGAAWIKARNGTIFTEAEETCVVYGMPGAVVEAGLSDRIIRLDQIGQALLEIA
jgi:two-component system chemotaxis response regulator CheB